VAIDDPERALEIVKLARRENPRIHIVARAHDRVEVYKLFQAGAHDIVRETFDSAVRAARYGLEALGLHPYEAEKITTVFVEEDKMAMRELAELWDPEVPVSENAAYVARARQINEREAAMQGDRTDAQHQSDRAWLPPIPDPDEVRKAGE
jgi:voltage-gated potassium channel Kch